MQNKHNGTIDFLKFLFACLILLFHGNSMIGTRPDLFPSGTIGVEFFFLVSGYLMAASAQKTLQKDKIQIGTETTIYLGKKIKHLFPYVLGAFVITLILRETLNQTNPAKIPSDVYNSLWELSFLWISGLGKVTVNAPSWYISAMLLSMLLLYPLLLKNFDLFTKVVAPAISIFGIGYISYTYGTLFSPAQWNGFFYKGLLRGFTELSLGCVCFTVSQWLMQRRFKQAGKVLLSIIEWGCYAIVFVTSTLFSEGKLSFMMLLALSLGITISFSAQSATAGLFQKPIFPFLGKLSLTIYLIHYPIRKVFMYLKPSLGYWKQMCLFVLISFVMGIIYLFMIEGIMNKLKIRGNTAS